MSTTGWCPMHGASNQACCEWWRTHDHGDDVAARVCPPPKRKPVFPTKGWCPACGGRDTACCSLWRGHPETPHASLAPHIHQAVQDPEACIAQCPVCRPLSRPLGQQEGQTAATIAYAVLQQAAERRSHASAIRKQHKAEQGGREADWKARQTRLL